MSYTESDDPPHRTVSRAAAMCDLPHETVPRAAATCLGAVLGRQTGWRPDPQCTWVPRTGRPPSDISVVVIDSHNGHRGSAREHVPRAADEPAGPFGRQAWPTGRSAAPDARGGPRAAHALGPEACYVVSGREAGGGDTGGGAPRHTVEKPLERDSQGVLSPDDY
uniref:Uncharacterized protein n=1 Tax=Eutreptiella gymnastica TaxID=73025 RepID=A0A7S1N463_9EUGL